MFYPKCMIVLMVQLVALMLRDVPFMHPGLSVSSVLHFPLIHSFNPSFNSYALSDLVTVMVFRFTEMIQTVHSRVERPQWRPTRAFKRVQGEAEWGSSNYMIRVRKDFKDMVTVEPNPERWGCVPQNITGRREYRARRVKILNIKIRINRSRSGNTHRQHWALEGLCTILHAYLSEQQRCSPLSSRLRLTTHLSHWQSSHCSQEIMERSASILFLDNWILHTFDDHIHLLISV